LNETSGIFEIASCFSGFPVTARSTVSWPNPCVEIYSALRQLHCIELQTRGLHVPPIRAVPRRLEEL